MNQSTKYVGFNYVIVPNIGLNDKTFYFYPV